MDNSCIICGSAVYRPVFYQDCVPVCQTPISPSEMGRELTGVLDIVECQNCSHIFNRAADSHVIEQMYEQSYSSGIPSTDSMLDNLHDIARNAIGYENIRDTTCLEIGASDFTFSNILLDKGASQVIAFEPSSQFSPKSNRIVHIKDYFSLAQMPKTSRAPTLTVLRHVLEHMLTPMKVLEDLCDMIPFGGLLYIEVPNVGDILEKERVYDLFYEHVSYFSPVLLQQLLRQLGFETVQTTELKGGQHFGLLCRKQALRNHSVTLKMDSLLPERSVSIQAFARAREKFRSELDAVLDPRRKTAVYGAGCHSLSAIMLLGDSAQKIQFLLDLNRLKTDKCLPVSHLKIYAPTEERLQTLDRVVIIAALHEKEIHRDLRQKYRFQGEVFGTYPEVSKLS